MFSFCRLADWRQRPDIIIIAPKVVDLGQTITGFSCPSAQDEIFTLGHDGESKLQHSGILQVIFVRHQAFIGTSSTQKNKRRDLGMGCFDWYPVEHYLCSSLVLQLTRFKSRVIRFSVDSVSVLVIYPIPDVSSIVCIQVCIPFFQFKKFLAKLEKPFLDFQF